MIEKIINQEICAGCGLCQSVIGSQKISIEYNKLGFLRPRLTDAINSDDLLQFSKYCPSINAKYLTTNKQDIIWGSIQSLALGHATDKNVRFKGSSGGTISALSIHLLESKTVECILQIGTSKDDPINNILKESTSKEDICDNAGSRYSPSAPLQNILKIIEKYNSVAFIGKPCDIVALRNIALIYPIINVKVKFMISFMCAGIPSIAGTKEILKKAQIREDEISTLKYRGEGWPGFFHVKTKDNKEFKMSYNDSWGKHLNKYLQLRCKVCADGSGEQADIVCADAWDITPTGFPSFEEKEGTSLLIARTNNGEMLLKECIKNNSITITNNTIKPKDINLFQPYQVRRKKNILARILPFIILNRIHPKYNYFTLFKATLTENPLRLFKNFLGSYIRLRKQ